ncbi:carbohydrate binding family 9 domain-containing protein [Aliikangiella marina]|uniref:Carbohydrate binding family 9 domain-containing protein n=1 Tax=Aliikangiella marina TaxID=1712262 RepID=A0A545T9V3_9GAMM|nr:carbohydrate binding family 9 domain-containing protein [Aliikangiella marina]TQV73989.1 carbohydrate binding family 9 domain-containing protein [Aliikangiella marina]
MTRSRSTFAFCVHSLILLLCLTETTNAQEINLKRQINIYELPHLEVEIDIDADLTEDVWKQALKIDLNYETDPGENTTPLARTEAYLFENGDAIHIGFIAYDNDPESIRDYLTDRDKIWESDFVGIKFDTFGEKRKAFQFFVNALGIQADATQEDFRGDDSNWDALWDSAGKITDFGYVVEMAIPFKSLRFPQSSEPQEWGFEILRFYPRAFRHRFANTPVDRNISCRVCQFDRLRGFANAKPSESLQFTPTLVIGQTESREDAFSPWEDSGIDNEVGLDFRWGITQDIILNATLNPDFSQVEADAAQLDVNNTDSLFLEEKRPFFLDGRDYFNTLRNLVYTRNIAAPDYGVKVTGQSNGHSFGAFVVNDETTQMIIPGRLGSSSYSFDEALGDTSSENQVLRYSYDFGNKNTAGLMYTHRSADNYDNRTFSFDGNYWLDEFNSVSLQYIATDTESPAQMVDAFADETDLIVDPTMSGDLLVAEYKYRSRNWWADFSYLDIDEGFRADLGFIRRSDFNKWVIGGGHRWFPDNGNNGWTRIALSGDYDRTEDQSGELLEEELEMRFAVNGAYQSEFRAGAGIRDRLWYALDNGDLNPELYRENFHYMRGQFRPIGELELELFTEWGDKVDVDNYRIGEQFRLRPEIEWQINTHWLTRLEYNFVDFDAAGASLFRAKIINYRLTYQFDVRSFLRFTLQRTDVSQNQANYIDDVDAEYKSQSMQLLYSYKVNPQTLFFAGYSDGGFQDDTVSSIEKTDRAVFMKFSYAWQL